jgi:DNA invertase Pin-like site-specific DNA recombinase
MTQRKRPSQLDARYDDLVTWKLQGRSDRSIAEEIGLANSTVSRFIAKPQFQTDLAKAHRELRRAAASRYAVAAPLSFQTHMQFLDPTQNHDKSDTDKLRAVAEFNRAAADFAREQLVEEISAGLSTEVAASARAKAAAIEATLADDDGDDGPAELAAVTS